MASPPTVSPEDERYLIAESEHVDQLLECYIRQLGLLIGNSSAGFGDWKTLAGRLSISNDDVRRIEAMVHDCSDGQLVPGEEVLKLWRRKEKSTIRVLRQVLEGMKRDDVIRELDYMRLSKQLIYTDHNNVIIDAPFQRHSSY